VQEILVSPDYASNFRGAQLAGVIGEDPESEYNEILGKIRRKEIENVLILGDRAIELKEMDEALLEGLRSAKVSVGVLTDADSPLTKVLSYTVPGRSVLEKSGLLLNRGLRLQYAQAVVPLREGTIPEWRFLAQLSEAAGAKVVGADTSVMNERELTRWYLSTDPIIASQGLSIQLIKAGGVQLQSSTRQAVSGDENAVGQGASAAV
jgi:NADH dehydrogenase/NADH:ubiquinone oxidoreductase subunit G